ncbi:hypothetical protein [Aquisphaera insulae]|uniref:hypothetical protein n=1 Tax=Aquisphaera insulae TaxID=2712864 RepID=UPI0013ED6156|nr:hypothetical protein [Aquisphaera insulae]
MGRTQISIAGLMWTIVLMAIGLAALKSGSETWSATIFLLTCGTLALGVVGIVCDAPVARRWWVGFTAFGAGYLLLAFQFRWEELEMPPIATEQLITWLGKVFGARFRGPVAIDDHSLAHFWPFVRIGHCLLALLIGMAAGLLAVWLFPAPGSEPDRVVGSVQEPGTATPAPGRWTWVGGGGLAMIYLVVALMGMRTAPVLWAGVTFLLTCACFGWMTLTAIFSRGRPRARWLGAFLFGVGYLALISWYSVDPSWAEIPGDRLIAVLRPYLHIIPTERRAETEGIAGANARILKALDQPFTFHFPNDVPLGEVLNDISTKVYTEDGHPLPIYVNPIDMVEADRTLESKVTLAVEGVPLRSGLHFLLEQLGLNYRIKGGLIEVVSEVTYYSQVELPDPAYEDPLMLTGHCILALAAAGLGGLLSHLKYQR